ncbi:amino acid/polyamine/organocation transporter, APC superfamily [Sphingomonas gellani]|uniref:Amino acid/polyamine/organocation transporter, APC superfamily n=2 Tax=Sphingomonas gellani TaxID=1166340 RepID=A0A1H7ZJK6_9SPHN|nr:amino acid/polyamine/organocation transporter, APC superfamily [Sphingomonas gellani]
MLDALIGRRLANREQGEQKIGWIAGVPAMGLDGLGSSSYGPEAALTILMPLGAASLAWIGWVIAPIVALLAVLYFSYRQTILAYPSNGGAYTVAKENLGPMASLLAAAALMIDYVLNVAVGISAGVGALTSSVPGLQPWTLELCLGILAVVAIANLRGTREAGWLFALPTYLFLLCFLGLIGWGLVQMVASGGHPHPVIAPPPLGHTMEAAGLWLLMHAFASGCTAMTGVEAVSNGVGAFKEPVVRNAHATLTVICVSLGLLLAGIAAVAHGYGLGAMDQTAAAYQSVLSQLAGAVAGRGVIYYVAMASLLAVLCLSANTSFVGFPRICRLVALDDYLPRGFAVADRRLVFSVGVIFLTVTAGGLLVAFGGITDHLIPLFAIGAFLTFTVSQVGMVAHWRQQQGRNAGRLAINALGAVTTFFALLVIGAAKFVEGAWIVVLAVPATIAILLLIRRYYDRLGRGMAATVPFALDDVDRPTVLVAYEERNRMTDRALQFAMTLSPDVLAVHLLRLSGPEQEEEIARLHDAFERDIAQPVAARGLTPPRLVQIPAPYREIEGPVLELVERIDEATPGRAVAILIPELALNHWWERLLHGRRAQRLRAALVAHAGPRLMIITSPWRRGLTP